MVLSPQILASCGALGGGVVGATPFGTMGQGLTVSQQISLTSVRVQFFQVPPPQILSAFRANDALNAKNWSVEVLEPFGSFTPLIQTVEAVEGEEFIVDVFTDASLTPGTVYRICTTALNTMGQPLICPDDAFRTFDERVIELGDRTDIANPNLLVDAPIVDPPPLGTNQITDRGDLALDFGRPYLRKRVFRRMATPLGGFYHLPGYGLAQPLKGRSTPDSVRQLRKLAEAQIKREPDVRRVRAIASRGPAADDANKNILFVTLLVEDIRGVVTTATVPINSEQTVR